MDKIAEAKDENPVLLANLAGAYMEIALPFIEKLRLNVTPTPPAKNLVNSIYNAVREGFKEFDPQTGTPAELSKHLAAIVLCTFNEVANKTPSNEMAVTSVPKVKPTPL